MIPFRTSVVAHGSPNTTMSLIFVNVAVFLVQWGLPPAEEIALVHTYGLVPGFYLDPTVAARNGISYHVVPSLVTNTFLHGGWLHLIVNMWTLWLFGVPVEDRIGHWRFLLFYLACGCLGSIAHLVFNLASFVPAVGASGAIAGVLGAFTWMYPRASVAVVIPIIIIPLIFHVPALLFTALWFLWQILQGALDLGLDSTAGGIAWWAHIGGFAGGLGIAMWFVRRRSQPANPWSS